LNFHTGEKVLPGTVGPDKPNVYTSLTSSANGYTILPPGYGIKMFELGGHGDLLPVAVEKNKEKVNLVAYGAMESPAVVNVTLINREYGPKGRAAEVEIEVGRAVDKAETMTMSQKDGEIVEVDGVTVGGAKFGEDGKWGGNWQSWSQAIDGKRKGKLKIEVPPATAILIRLSL
jgi:hypothetical protein